MLPALGTIGSTAAASAFPLPKSLHRNSTPRGFLPTVDIGPFKRPENNFSFLLWDHPTRAQRLGSGFLCGGNVHGRRPPAPRDRSKMPPGAHQHQTPINPHTMLIPFTSKRGTASKVAREIGLLTRAQQAGKLKCLLLKAPPHLAAQALTDFDPWHQAVFLSLLPAPAAALVFSRVPFRSQVAILGQLGKLSVNNLIEYLPEDQARFFNKNSHAKPCLVSSKACSSCLFCAVFRAGRCPLSGEPGSHSFSEVTPLVNPERALAAYLETGRPENLRAALSGLGLQRAISLLADLPPSNAVHLAEQPAGSRTAQGAASTPSASACANSPGGPCTLPC